jgi:hypothetical protein
MEICAEEAEVLPMLALQAALETEADIEEAFVR